MKKLFAEKIILSTSKNNFIWSGNNRFLKTDLLHITNNEQTLNIYSKLSISWGFISCVDIYTEWMRKLGDFRFTS